MDATRHYATCANGDHITCASLFLFTHPKRASLCHRWRASRTTIEDEEGNEERVYVAQLTCVLGK